MSKTQVRLTYEGAHAAITLHTDSGVNVFSADTLHKLQAAVREISENTAIRTTAVQAVGKVFVAGADIKEMASFGPDEAHAYGQLGQDVLNEITRLPSITVAAINGAALGGGLELALACDFRIAVKHAKVGLPEASLGLIPGWSGIPRSMKLIGPSRAKRLFLSATPISAEEGFAMGLVDELVNSAEDLPPRVYGFCKLFHRASPNAAALCKRAARDADDLGAFADCFRHKDAKEGIAAFIEKRPASWME